MEDESMHIVMEYAEQGDLYKVMLYSFNTVALERITTKKKVLC